MANSTLSSYLVVVVLLVLIQGNVASPVAVDLTRVYSAVAKGAVCLDGRPPAYQFDKGNAEGINNWLINLEGSKFYMRGARVFDAIMEDLLEKGMKDASNLENIFALTYLPKVGHSWIKCSNNTEYCSASQIKRLEGLKSEFVNTVLTRLGNPSSGGWFINSCYAHCQSLFGPSWLGPNVTLNHKASVTINKRLFGVVLKKKILGTE
ncbi:hypothetical protein LguiA_017821 [Lonicera macranthoides]